MLFFGSCRGSRRNRFTTIIRILFVTSEVSDVSISHFWWWSSCLVLLTLSMASQCWNSHNWNVKICRVEKATSFVRIFSFAYSTTESRIWKPLILKGPYWMFFILTRGFLQSLEQFKNINAIWQRFQTHKGKPKKIQGIRLQSTKHGFLRYPAWNLICALS